MIQAKAVIDKHTSIMPQMTLADFIAEGHFGRHIKRTRKVYAERQASLIHSLEKELGDEVICGAQDGGLDLAVYFKQAYAEEQIIAAGKEIGLELRGLGHYADVPGKTDRPAENPGGLLLGFASLTCAEIERSVSKLATLFKAAA